MASVGGRPKRGDHSNEKFKQYSFQLLYSESKRIVRRLQNQKDLFTDLLQTDNVDMMNREVKKLDGILEQLLETYARIRDLVQEMGTFSDDRESEHFQSLVAVVDKEDSAVFTIKKDVSAWMVAHSRDVETLSVGSGRSGRSRESRAAVSQRTQRSGSLRSVRSGSTESVRSVKSDGSRTSRVSQKAKVAGLKAELEVLTNEGEKEISEQVRNMKLAAEIYEREQSALLKAEMVQIKERILLQDGDVRDEENFQPHALQDYDLAAKDSGNTELPNHDNVLLQQWLDNLMKVPDSGVRSKFGDESNYYKGRPSNIADEGQKIDDRSHIGHVIGGMKALADDLRREEELPQTYNLDQDEGEEECKKVRKEQVYRDGHNQAMNLMQDCSVQVKPPLNVTTRRRKVEINTPGISRHDDHQPTNEGAQNRVHEKSFRVSTTTDQVAEFSLSMLKMLKAQSAPKVDIDTFSGDSIEYVYFRENFRDMVESVVEDQRGRLNRLIQYTSGEAKELIRHCIHNDPNNCYNDAISLLEREYGNPLRIGCAYLEKLKNWPAVKNGDASGFRSLYRFLLQCLAYQKNGFLSGLDSPLMIRSIQLKLPVNMQDKWSHIVCKVRKRDERETVFKDFVAFVESESAVLNDPIYSRGVGEKLKVNKIVAKPGTKLPTKQTEEPVEEVNATQESALIVCPCCSSQHDLDDCEDFKKKTIKERKQCLYELKLCWACYGPGHKAQECVQKRVCNICSQSHPTALHVFKTNAICEQGNGNGSGMCVVPVQLSHSSHPGEKLLVYAMLDECSQGCFIKEDVLMHFSKAPKIETSITTETLHGDETLLALRSSGFGVECSASHELEHNPSEMVLLPTVYSRTDLPMEVDDIPSKEFVSRWDYLERVSRTFSEATNINIPVGLLIGRNCPKAMEPVEVIASKGEGPYAYRTRLGWCVGSTWNESNKITVNKISLEQGRLPVKDIASGLPSSRLLGSSEH